MKRCLLSSALFLSSIVIICKAQTYQPTELGVKAKIKATEIEIQFYSPSIARVIKYPEGKPFVKQSLSVIQVLQKTEFSIKQHGDELSLKSKNLTLSLNLKNGKVFFTNPTGENLLTEKEAGFSFADFNDAGAKTFTISQSFLLEKEEVIYGLGQLHQGKMSQRNQKVRMIQSNLEDYIPFFQSAKGYGLFWDNYSPTVFEDNNEHTSFTSEVGDGIDYYFMYGSNADGVIACMRNLTGQAPMFPMWTYGFWQSRERYKSQDELVGVVKKYRELGVPLDGIIQDWQYWGSNYLWNAMEFLNPGFHDPQKMVNDVHGLNSHMIISIWSSFGPHTKPYKELENINALFNFKTWPSAGTETWPPNPDYPSGVRVYDPYNPAARDIYWKYLNKGIFSLGIDGWWMDSTEPDHLDAQPSDFDSKTYLGSFRKVRNAFPLMTVGGVSQHQRSVTSDKRVFILTRSAFAGQQRYGANTWSGDVTASWKNFRNQIPAGLNLSLTGIPYWNSDIGGFFLWNFKNPLENADYRELQVRWMEFGTFCPMMRSHGEGSPREIYQFGKKGEKVYDAIEKYINLRYRLLPYIYSTSWNVTARQSSIMRALVMDFQTDARALDINDEFMFGKSLLVNPVTTPMYSKIQVQGKDTVKVEDFSVIKTKDVYLPKGFDWYDFWTGEKFSGGQLQKKETPLEIIPLYVKAGSVLPIGPKVQYATEKKWNDLEIRIYEGANGEFTLYEDENDNYNYEKGIYSTITFNWDNSKKTLTISDRKGSFPGMLALRNFGVVIVGKDHGIGDGTTNRFDKLITYSGKKVVVKL
ncbi:MAG TPA: TIM-barrel domain-containing protein [Cyclobacteriaceae bacterium]|nr:TIM-barrel domain-containing protein [Cyclobacteriaceae bacterium]